MTGVLDNTVQDNITRLGTVTSGTIGSGVTNNAGVSSGVINNAVSGFTGIKNVDTWCVTSSTTDDTGEDTITANWAPEEKDKSMVNDYLKNLNKNL